MRAVLDTHALLWWIYGNTRLSQKAKSFMAHEDNNILVSAVSAWEIAIKFRIGKLAHAAQAAGNLPHLIRVLNFRELSVTVAHAQRAGLLPTYHWGPFDRMLMLIAQAQVENTIGRIPFFPVRRRQR